MASILQLAGMKIRLDTYPDHWRCAKCETAEPHVHEERGEDGIWRHRDYGYDVRDQS